MDSNEILDTLRSLRYKGLTFTEIIYELSVLVGETADAAVGKDDMIVDMASELQYQLRDCTDVADQLDKEMYYADNPDFERFYDEESS